jgi:hypothetical protein
MLLVPLSWTPAAVETVVLRFEFATTEPELAVKDMPLEPELWSAAEVVTVAQEIDKFPDTVIGPEGFVKTPAPEQVKDKALVAVVLMADETDIFPGLLNVAVPVLSWFWIAVGVRLEAPPVLVYQVPLNHSPPESRAAVETVIEEGRPLVVTALEDADQAPVDPPVIGATWKM